MDVIKSAVAETALLLQNASYLESQYQKVLGHLLIQRHMNVSSEVHIAYKLPDGFVFGSGRIDLMFETDTEMYIIELKVQGKIATTVGQLKRYMVHIDNPQQKIIRGCIVSFNHFNQYTTKFMTLASKGILNYKMNC